MGRSFFVVAIGVWVLLFTADADAGKADTGKGDARKAEKANAERLIIEAQEYEFGALISSKRIRSRPIPSKIDEKWGNAREVAKQELIATPKRHPTALAAAVGRVGYISKQVLRRKQIKRRAAVGGRGRWRR